MKFDGLYFTYWMDTGYEGGGRSIVWPWKFGWHSSQMITVGIGIIFLIDRKRPSV